MLMMDMTSTEGLMQDDVYHLSILDTDGYIHLQQM